MPAQSLRRRDFVALIGGGVAWPFAGQAQQSSKIPTVGVLWHAGSPEEEQPFFGALREGFKDLGYVEGQNIRLEHRFPNEIPNQFRSMIAELVALKVDVVVSVTPASFYAKDATGTIPHVFVLVPDPVGSKFVDSLARPGGNATGLSLLSTDLTKKRVQLLQEAIPGLSFAGLLVNPNTPATRATIDEARGAAAEIGLTLQIFEAPSLNDLEAAFDAMERAGIHGLIVGAAGLFYQGKAIIAKLATAHRLPTSFWARELMEPGAFMSYGPSMAGIVRRAPIYVDRILKGARLSELPVEQPTKFELLINLKTAKAYGIDVPQVLLARADEVIE
ncbi:putative ABC transport system substrate-binding protein [Rhizobiales bacterium GAS191]|nr:putative ABC transport system substrate-binding protein [Rhizobiales bacterium GAS191]